MDCALLISGVAVQFSACSVLPDGTGLLQGRARIAYPSLDVAGISFFGRNVAVHPFGNRCLFGQPRISTPAAKEVIQDELG